jgi:primosomal protein N' (replication factor Y)
MSIYKVLVTSPVAKTYDYLPPEGPPPGVGDYVTVPLGPRLVTGVVWGIAEAPENLSSKLKSIAQKYDLPPMSAAQRDFLDWAAKYNMASPGAVLKMAVPVDEALIPPEPMTGYGLTQEISSPQRGEDQGEGGKLSPQQRRVFDVLQDGQLRRLADIAREADVTPGVIKTMLKNGIVCAIDMFAAPPCHAPNPDFCQRSLSKEQQEAANKLTARVGGGGFEAFLLDGVTGAGKTEVYFEGVAQALRQGKQVLILLPEIALSNSFIGRFRERFGVAPALWHSSCTAAQRCRTWRGIVSGQTKVIVGARSALFLPYSDLGLIIVDEEHDGAFKQEDGVFYHARDMAVACAHREKFPVILASATPSLETMQNVWDKKYTHLVLPDRFGFASKPEIEIIDLKECKPERQHFISPVLKDAIALNLEMGQQSLLFLNRRGYAPLTLCRTCGYRFECPRCTAWLVEHRREGKLQCHHCGYECRIPEKCPTCNDTGSLAPCGPGVERIAEEVKESFPDARTLILASDVTDTHKKLSDALESIHRHDVDIIIGTQIIAKGHHFPKLTCVGIVDGDLGLSGGELRASERAFQLLHQVAGRAGREKLKGKVYLQTWNPLQKVMQLLAKDDRDGFLAAEAEERRRAFMPPFSRLAGIILTGPHEDKVRAIARELAQAVPKHDKITVLGPAPAQMFRIRGKFRFRFLVQADKSVNLQAYIDDWLKRVKIPSTIRCTVDIDPQSFF